MGKVPKQQAWRCRVLWENLANLGGPVMWGGLCRRGEGHLQKGAFLSCVPRQEQQPEAPSCWNCVLGFSVISMPFPPPCLLQSKHIDKKSTSSLHLLVAMQLPSPLPCFLIHLPGTHFSTPNAPGAELSPAAQAVDGPGAHRGVCAHSRDVCALLNAVLPPSLCAPDCSSSSPCRTRCHHPCPCFGTLEVHGNTSRQLGPFSQTPK